MPVLVMKSRRLSYGGEVVIETRSILASTFHWSVLIAHPEIVSIGIFHSPNLSEFINDLLKSFVPAGAAVAAGVIYFDAIGTVRLSPLP